MIRYLIKNNFKLMFRNKWIIVTLILGPVLVIAILSSAFSDLMKSYEGTGHFQAGYRAEENSVFAGNLDAIKAAGKETGITFLEYPEGEPKELIENNGLAGFVEFGTDSYTVYESADFKTEGITLEYFLNCVMDEYVNYSLQETASGSGGNTVDFSAEQLDYMPAVDSKDYYGIIYIVYFAWMGIVCAANVLSNEKKYGIDRKYQVTAVSDFKMYLGKWIPTVLVVSAGIAFSTFLTVLLFGIHWGNTFVSAIIMLLTIMAGTAFGFMFYSIFRNMAMTVIAVFTSVWFMGFVGGSFETYMYTSFVEEPVKRLSPIYHANRALVEISCMGKSGYTRGCIIYLIIVLVVCSVIAGTADWIRKRGRA